MIAFAICFLRTFQGFCIGKDNAYPQRQPICFPLVPTHRFTQVLFCAKFCSETLIKDSIWYCAGFRPFWTLSQSRQTIGVTWRGNGGIGRPIYFFRCLKQMSFDLSTNNPTSSRSTYAFHYLSNSCIPTAFYAGMLKRSLMTCEQIKLRLSQRG